MTVIPAHFPEFVKFNPLVGLKSFHTSGAGGAWRLLVLAKALDINGVGKIPRDYLQRFALSLGIQSKTFNRWLTAARNLDFVFDIQSQSGEWMLILVSNEKAASIIGCESKGKAVTMSVKLLIGKKWRAYVFGAFENTFNGRLITRKKQAELSGIPESTQRKFDKEAGVERKKNFAISNIHANGYSAVLEFGNRASLFKYWDKKTHQLKLGWRLPDSRYFGGAVTNGSKNTLWALSLFNRTDAQYKATVKKLSKSDSPIREVYLFSHTSKNGADMWFHMPLR
jgi:hypothetical protein